MSASNVQYYISIVGNNTYGTRVNPNCQCCSKSKTLSMHGCRWCGDDGVSASNVQYYISIVGTQIIHMAHVLTPIANAAAKVKPYAHAWM